MLGKGGGGLPSSKCSQQYHIFYSMCFAQNCPFFIYIIGPRKRYSILLVLKIKPSILGCNVLQFTRHLELLVIDLGFCHIDPIVNQEENIKVGNDRGHDIFFKV